MNYFLINNGFHVTDVLDLIGDEPASLIIVPHMMNREIPDNRFEQIITIKSPLRSPEKAWMDTFQFASAQKRVDEAIHPSPKDILFVYTEYELLNHHIAYRFKKAGAKVVLIEEGIAALVTLSTSDKLMRPDWKFCDLWIRYVFGLKQSFLTVQSGVCMPVINDAFWDSACIYHGNTMARSFEPDLIKHKEKPRIELKSGCIVFVNQPIYEWYLPFDEYTGILHRCLSSLSKSFSSVHFKFHPRETIESKRKILRALIDIKYEVIEDPRGIELLYEEIRPSHIASFFSTGLLNASDLGIQPIFFYHLIPNANTSTLFVTIEKILTTLGITQNLLPEEVSPKLSTIPQNKSIRMNFTDLLKKLTAISDLK